MPTPDTPHHDFHDVLIKHGGRRWTAAYHLESGRLTVSSAWGSLSEPIRDDVDPRSRAAELLHAMVAARRVGDPTLS